MSRRRFILAACLVALSACAPAEVPLTAGDILADPARYKDQVVELDGEVVDANGIFSIGVYSLRDSSGEINVLTSDGLPAVGSSFKVRGTVVNGITFGGKRYGVAVNETERIYPQP